MANVAESGIGPLVWLLGVAGLSWLLLRFALPQIVARKTARTALLFGGALTLFALVGALLLAVRGAEGMALRGLPVLTTLAQLRAASMAPAVVAAGTVDPAQIAGPGGFVAYVEAGEDGRASLGRFAILMDGARIEVADGYRPVNWPRETAFLLGLRPGDPVVVWGRAHRTEGAGGGGAGLAPRVVWRGAPDAFQAGFAAGAWYAGAGLLLLAALAALASPVPLWGAWRRWRAVARRTSSLRE